MLSTRTFCRCYADSGDSTQAALDLGESENFGNDDLSENSSGDDHPTLLLSEVVLAVKISRLRKLLPCWQISEFMPCLYSGLRKSS